MTLEFEIKFRPDPDAPLVTYELHIGLDKQGLPIVSKELLKYRRGQYGKPWHFLDFSNGSGTAILNENEYGQTGARERREEQKLDAPDILAINGFSQLTRAADDVQLKNLIAEGDLPGALWKQGFFKGAGPS